MPGPCPATACGLPARDHLLTREDEEALAAAIPGSRLIVYEDTGHLVLWEQPRRVAADLAAFTENVLGQRG